MELKTLFNDHWMVIAVIWLTLLILFMVQCFRHLLQSSPDYIIIKQKGLRPLKVNPKFLLNPIFSNPSVNFSMQATITIQILYEKQPNSKEQVKLARIEMQMSKAETIRQLCCFLYYRWFVLFERKKYMVPITHVQAIHDSPKGEKIFFEGIEVTLPDDGYSLFYSVREQVENASDFKQTKTHSVKPPKLFTAETFCPTFRSLTVETFGDKFVHPNTHDQTRGVRVQPKLNWLEELIFFALLVTVTYCVMFGFLIQFKSLFTINDGSVIVCSVFTSSLMALLITELFAHIYRRAIKAQYNTRAYVKDSSCACIWVIILLLSNFFLLTMSVTATVLPDLVLTRTIPGNNNKTVTTYLNMNGMNETPFLLLCLLCTLLITSTIGTLLFGLIRYLIRWFTFESYSTQADTEKGLVAPTIYTETSDATEASTLSDKVVERKKTGQDLNQIKQISEVAHKTDGTTEKTEKSKRKDAKKSQKKSPPKKAPIRGQRLTFNTDRLEREYADKEKKKRLITESVITKPRKSKGFENPENFRLSDS